MMNRAGSFSGLLSVLADPLLKVKPLHLNESHVTLGALTIPEKNV